ncbi:MAG: M16 family metallopeptidase [Bacteroidia bacterium]
MIQFEKHTLSNGLKVIVHEDRSTPIAAMNILYDVGARDEDPDKTGFAHLFEHLMFGGSINIPNYDEPLQNVGGENNAFTSNDITNYYLTLPAQNLETGFWLESDRMLSLAFSEKSLEVQRNVVIEEFRQRYLNQPYGDVWLKLKPLAYKVHPYLWNTIGKEISHIENATMDDVKAFFKKHYLPHNAILSVAGNVKTDEVLKLAEKWFGPIAKGEKKERKLPVEPPQTEERKQETTADVPYDAIYKAWHMCDRKNPDYYTFDVISELFSRGKSSRLYVELVKNKKLFSEINAYISGDSDPGLLVIAGKVSEGVDMKAAEAGIAGEVNKLRSVVVEENELQKIKNNMEASLVFSEMGVENKALNLAIFELMGDAEGVNHETEKYQAVTRERVKELAEKTLVDTNCSTLYYHAKKS